MQESLASLGKLWQPHLAMQSIATIGTPEAYAERLRAEWAASLKEHMKLKRLGRKELRKRLEEIGWPVSRQTIDMWLGGKTAPAPHHQAVLAAVLETPVRYLFPIEALVIGDAA